MNVGVYRLWIGWLWSLSGSYSSTQALLSLLLSYFWLFAFLSVLPPSRVTETPRSIMWSLAAVLLPEMGKCLFNFLFIAGFCMLLPRGKSTDDMISELEADREKAQKTLDKLQGAANYQAIMDKHGADPSSLTADEREFYRDWRDAKAELRSVETNLCQLQETKRMAKATGVPTFTPVPKLRGHDQTWVNKTGKVSEGNREQWKRAEQHYNLYQDMKTELGKEEISVDTLVQLADKLQVLRYAMSRLGRSLLGRMMGEK